jgi:hypothetical protein
MRATALALTIALLAGPGCALRTPGASMIETRLFLGGSRPDGGLVDDAAWQAFLTEVVTPRFPEGLTVVEAKGQWLDPGTSTIVREPAKVLILVHPPGVTADAAVDAVASEYKRRFDQRSVLRVDVPVRAAF